MRAYRQSGGKVIEVNKLNPNDKYINLPKGLYPEGAWQYHVVHINKKEWFWIN